VTTTTAVATDFFKHLERSKLLSREEIVAAARELGLSPHDAPIPVAKAFVRAGLLTRFQASRVLDGRHRGFFIDNLKIEEVLGSGGMGWVYIARDLDTNEQVALKMLCQEDEKDYGLITRFKMESRASKSLNHHAVIRTRRTGQTSGLYGEIYYMVMDLMVGVGVDEFVAMGGKFTVPLACHVVQHVCAGLHHAHRMGMVHRDIKPGNILIDHVSNARILDFGLSLSSNSEEDDEFSLAMIFGHDCLGTADYISPEQARDSFRVDRRADIYSVGATMYYMLTGQVMFPQCVTRAEKVDAQRKMRPRPIRELCPDCPSNLVAIINTMLAKNVEQRFKSARAICKLMTPFAKPSKIRFDFKSLLDRRYSIALQRQKLQDEKKRAMKQDSPSAPFVQGRHTVNQAAVDTSIRKDTHVDNRT
jgi:serine/threonine protein kinase